VDLIDLTTWILLGAAIGATLEAGGLGNPRKLTGVFTLRDPTVVIVMPAAIVAAMLVLLVATLFGAQWARYFTPPTLYAGQALGGFVFGVGFFLGGYCPGTSVVGLASGRLDALPFIGGMVGGYYAWDAMRESVRGWLERAPRGSDTLPALIGLDPRLFAAILVAAAAAAIWRWRAVLLRR